MKVKSHSDRKVDYQGLRGGRSPANINIVAHTSWAYVRVSLECLQEGDCWAVEYAKCKIMASCSPKWLSKVTLLPPPSPVSQNPSCPTQVVIFKFVQLVGFANLMDIK